jgi:hypothetical protein
MAILVETFEMEEVSSETVESCKEAFELIEKLNLEGQKKLLSPSTDNEFSRIPYPEATEEQKTVFRTLCPSSYDYKQYSRTPIPLRVLQILSHAESLNFFDEIVIWDVKSSEEKDPVLVGIKKEANYNIRYFLLARWGEELDAWTVLRTKALKIRKEQIKSALLEIISLAENRIKNFYSDDYIMNKDQTWKPSWISDLRE